MTTTTKPRVTGKALIKSVFSEGHAGGAICPGCDLDVTTIGITSLVYSFERCDCGTPEYPHLVEQLWHRYCFIDQEEADDGDD